MKLIKAFQTSDGEVHTGELDATIHEFEIELRGIIQSSVEIRQLTGNTVSIGYVCNKFATSSDALFNVLAKYRKKIKALRLRGNPAATPVLV